MKTLLITCFAITFSTAAMSADRVFECHGSSAQEKASEVTLTKYDGQNKGQITLDGFQTDLDVHNGLGTLNFLFVDATQVFSYTVNPENQTYDYSASGKIAGHGKGTCTEVTG
ncbi:MAG: hypothetical protein WBH04_14250 [Albidovulum sp.]|jgi:hypothetical protein